MKVLGMLTEVLQVGDGFSVRNYFLSADYAGGLQALMLETPSTYEAHRPVRHPFYDYTISEGHNPKHLLTLMSRPQDFPIYYDAAGYAYARALSIDRTERRWDLAVRSNPENLRVTFTIMRANRSKPEMQFSLASQEGFSTMRKAVVQHFKKIAQLRGDRPAKIYTPFPHTEYTTNHHRHFFSYNGDRHITLEECVEFEIPRQYIQRGYRPKVLDFKFNYSSDLDSIPADRPDIYEIERMYRQYLQNLMG